MPAWQAMPWSTVTSRSGSERGEILDQAGRQAVAVHHAVRHRMRDAARAEQAQPAHADGAGGGAVAVEVADHDDVASRAIASASSAVAASSPPSESGGSRCARRGRAWSSDSAPRAAYRRRSSGGTSSGQRAVPRPPGRAATDGADRASRASSGSGAPPEAPALLARDDEARAVGEIRGSAALTPAGAQQRGDPAQSRAVDRADSAQVDQRAVAAHRSPARPPRAAARPAPAARRRRRGRCRAVPRTWSGRRARTPEPQRVDRRPARGDACGIERVVWCSTTCASLSKARQRRAVRRLRGR